MVDGQAKSILRFIAELALPQFVRYFFILSSQSFFHFDQAFGVALLLAVEIPRKVCLGPITPLLKFTKAVLVSYPQIEHANAAGSQEL